MAAAPMDMGQACQAAVDEIAAAGVPLSPTFVAFTPWTSVDGYLDLLRTIVRLGLIERVGAEMAEPAAAPAKDAASAAGGQSELTELLDDVSFRVLPITAADAWEKRMAEGIAYLQRQAKEQGNG